MSQECKQSLKEICRDHYGYLLVYLTPEKIGANESIFSAMEELNNQNRLKRFVIDEAHCVSKWGRDFRNEYLNLRNLKKRFPKVPMMALTATAPEEVKQDVIEILGMQNCWYLQSSFNRPNLYYEVRKREKWQTTIEQIVTFIKKNHLNSSGIIYCLTKQECEDVSAELNKHGMNTAFFHAGMTNQKRIQTHEAWLVDEIRVIVATVAFGMGIDKKDCRFVIHF